MSSVFIITAGSYSDYHIEGVFSSLEKAQEVFLQLARDKGRCQDDAQIEEYELDSLGRSGNPSIFAFHMDREGNTSGFQSGISETGRTSFELKAVYYTYRPTPVAFLVCNVVANSAEHAVKIANEHRTQMIASGEWDGLELQEWEKFDEKWKRSEAKPENRGKGRSEEELKLWRKGMSELSERVNTCGYHPLPSAVEERIK